MRNSIKFTVTLTLWLNIYKYVYQVMSLFWCFQKSTGSEVAHYEGCGSEGDSNTDRGEDFMHCVGYYKCRGSRDST